MHVKMPPAPAMMQPITAGAPRGNTVAESKKTPAELPRKATYAFCLGVTDKRYARAGRLARGSVRAWSLSKSCCSVLP